MALRPTMRRAEHLRAVVSDLADIEVPLLVHLDFVHAIELAGQRKKKFPANPARQTFDAGDKNRGVEEA